MNTSYPLRTLFSLSSLLLPPPLKKHPFSCFLGSKVIQDLISSGPWTNWKTTDVASSWAHFSKGSLRKLVLSGCTTGQMEGQMSTPKDAAQSWVIVSECMRIIAFRKPSCLVQVYIDQSRAEHRLVWIFAWDDQTYCYTLYYTIYCIIIIGYSSV